MPTNAELLKIIKKDPGRIKDFPDASEEVMLACIKKSPFWYDYIKNPTPAVSIAAFSKEASLIARLSNPTEAEQLAAIKNNAQVLPKIKNPTRKTVLLALKTYGHAYYELNAEQKQLGAEFQASKLTLKDDIEIQVATLSNITGLSLLDAHPELFNVPTLTEQHPKLMARVNAWLALGFDYTNAQCIKEQLRAAKVRTKQVAAEYRPAIPDDFSN